MKYSLPLSVALILTSACATEHEDPVIPPPPPVAAGMSILIDDGGILGLHAGQSVKLSARIWDLDFNPIASPVTWSTASPLLATVSAEGLVQLRPEEPSGTLPISIFATSGSVVREMRVYPHDWRRANVGTSAAPIPAAYIPPNPLPPFGQLRLELLCESGVLSAMLRSLTTPTLGQITYWFDNEQPVSDEWALSGASLRYAGTAHVRELAAKMLTADSMHITYTGRNSFNAIVPMTLVFPMGKFSNVFPEVAVGCP